MMDRRQILIWFFYAMISGSLSEHKNLTSICLDARTDYINTKSEMLQLKYQIKLEHDRLGSDTFSKLRDLDDHQLMGRDGEPTCADTYIRILAIQLDGMLRYGYPPPCDPLSKEIERRMNWQLSQAQEIADNITSDQYCETHINDSISESKMESFSGKVIKMKELWLDYKRNGFVEDWRKMTNCYRDVYNALKIKLSNRPDLSGECETLPYQKFLDRNRFSFLQETKPISRFFWSYNVFNLPPADQQITKDYQEKSEIRENLERVRVLLENIVGKMDPLLNETTNRLGEDLSMMMNVESVAPKYQACFPRLMRAFIAAVNYFFNNDLQNYCFGVLRTVRNGFNNMDKCELQLFEARLSKINNCWADQDDCHEISSRLKEMNATLLEWNGFVSSPPFENVKNCYTQAENMIYNDIMGSIESYKKCESISIPDVFKKISKPVYSHLTYPKAKNCPQ